MYQEVAWLTDDVDHSSMIIRLFRRICAKRVGNSSWEKDAVEEHEMNLDALAPYAKSLIKEVGKVAKDFIRGQANT